MSTATRSPTSAPTAPPRAATWELARIEAIRMLRHPAPWIGLLLSIWMAHDSWAEDWSGQRYMELPAATTLLLLGISLASVSVFGRELVPVAEDAPVDRSRRSVARLLGGLPLVGVVAVVVAATAVWLRSTGGVPLGDEPGRTLDAQYTLPELAQPVLLACVAVAAGAALVHVMRHRLAASIVLAIGWFMLGVGYWIFNGDVLRWITPMQIQPVGVGIGSASTDPSTFPSSWLLSPPGEYQVDWQRLVVSPGLALAHDVYLAGVVGLLVAVAVPGRWRRTVAVVGLLLAVAGVALQWTVEP
jgi:hypothetical protein